MGAAFRRRHSVTIAGIHAIGIADTGSDPSDGPFHTAVAAGFLHFTGKGLRRDDSATADLLFQIVLQPIGEFQRVFSRAFFFVLNQRRVAAPANFNTAKQIGFGFRHRIEPCRIKLDFAENIFIGHKADRGAAFVFRFPDFFHFAFGEAARKFLPMQGLVACYLNHKVGSQRIDHRHADTVQTARCVISFAAEFTARMQRRHNHFKGGFVFIFRVRVNRDTAPIIAHGQAIAFHKLDFDKAGMTGHCLIHRIVDDLGEEMVHGAAVCAANIHARAAAHRFQPFKHLNIGSGIAFFGVFLRFDSSFFGFGGRCLIEQIG